MNKKITKSLLILFLILIGLNTLHAVDNTTKLTDNNDIKQDTSIEEDTIYSIDITRENYHDYFTNDNELNQSKLKSNTQLNIHSIPDNTQEISIYPDDNPKVTNLTINGVDNLTLYNTAITISSSIENFKLSNITLNYNQSYEEGTFLYIENTDNIDNYLLENINITCIQNKPTYQRDIHPVHIDGKNIQLKNFNINTKLPSNTISYQGTDNKPQAIALYIQGENITLTNSNITVIEHDKDIYTTYNTLYALYNEADYFTMTNTQLYIEGEEYIYAVVSRSNNAQINNNKITAKSTVYAAGINIEGTNIQNNNITRNHVNITAGNRQQGTTPNGAEDSAYGIILLDYSYKGGKYTPNQYSINNTTYTNNTITGTAGNIYAIEVFGGTNTNLSNNNIKITGRTPMAIGAIGENITINNNNITSEGQTNNTEGSADYLKPRTTGIYTYLSNKGITIDNNTINTRRGRGIYIEQTNNTMVTNNKITTNRHDYTIEITGTNNTIIHNYLISRNHQADDSVQTTPNNSITNNTNTTLKTQTITTLPPIHGLIDEKINITATITDTYQNPINTGYVQFTDINKNIQEEAQVTNGKATITIQFNKPIDTILIATYTPSDPLIEESQTANTLTITKKPTPTLNINTIQNNDNTLTIISTIQNTNNPINKGKITFKINGKTLKDNNGKTIYAKVVNSAATIENYVVPKDWSKDGTTIQAIYSGSTQCEKLTSEKTEITLTTLEPTITITPITSDVQTGSTVTLKAKVAAGDNAITTGKIVFKVNGKTVKDTNGKVIYAKVDSNGEASVDYTIPESFKAGTYNIEAVFTASGYEKLTDNTTMTVVKS